MNGKRDERGKERTKGFGVGIGFIAGKTEVKNVHVNYVAAMEG